MKLLVVDGRTIDEANWVPSFTMVMLKEEPIYDNAEEESEMYLKRFPKMGLFRGEDDRPSSMSFMYKCIFPSIVVLMIAWIINMGL